MPIYAYRCDACGFAKDVLQKMSDDPLTICPECQQANFKKQVTAAGFQLKGSGWYVTDFRGGNANGAGATTGVSASNEEATKNTSCDTTTSTAAESSSTSSTSSTCVAPAPSSDQAA